MELIELEQKFREAVKMIEEKGKGYAEAKSLYDFLYEQKKVLLASEFRKSQAKTVTERENEALTSQIYSTHLHAIKEAQADALRFEAEYNRWKVQADAIRTLISLEKEKMRLI